MRTIAIVALKGSQTKTTSTVNLAACLAGQGRRVLVLDLDTQANTTYVLLRGAAPKRPTVSEVLTGDVAAADAIVPTGFKGVELVPSSADLADVNIAIGNEVGRERRLRVAMDGMTRRFDVCLIDTGPTRTLLTTNALNYAGEVFVPIAPGVFAFLGLGQLQADITLVRKFLENKSLALAGVFLAMTERTTVSRDFEAGIRATLGELVMRTAIPRSVKAEEANARCLSIFEHDPDGPVAEAYRALTTEVLSRGGEEERDDAPLGDPPGDDAPEAGPGAGGRRPGRRRAG